LLHGVRLLLKPGGIEELTDRHADLEAFPDGRC
jgi:hypothetical protein